MQTATPVFVDWLTAVGTDAKHGSWLRKFLRGQVAHAGKTAYHRSASVYYRPSMFRHYYSPNDDTVGSVLVGDGQTWADMRNDHDNDYTLKVARLIGVASTHFSRIDLSVDIMDDGFFASELYAYVNVFLPNPVPMFGRRKVTAIRSEGTTVYIGSRASPIYLRIYDKKAETHGRIPATRIEFECKAEVAHEIHKQMTIYNGWLKAAPIFNSLLSRMGDWTDFRQVEEITLGQCQVIDIPKSEPMMNRKEWLRRQVMPSFDPARHHNAEELYQWFATEVIKMQAR
jgi:DNA relaxase NicK